MYSYKLNEQNDKKNQKIYQNPPINCFFIFVCKLFKRAELRDKSNATEHRNRVTTRKIMFRLSLWKNQQVSKLCIIFVAILQSLKDSTVPQHWTKLIDIGYKEWKFAAAWTTDMYIMCDKK